MPHWIALTLTAGLLTAPTTSQPGRQNDFIEAAREFGVPLSVLLAVSYLHSRWDDHGGQPSVSGGYGPMHLVDGAAVPLGGHHEGDPRGDDSRPLLRPLPQPPRAPEDTLRPAARLSGTSVALVRRDPRANIRAGAALLASHRVRPGGEPRDWYEAVVRYAGSKGFADEVFTVIREGAARRTDDGSYVRLVPAPDAVPPPPARTPMLGRADEPAARAQGRTDCPATLACEWMPAAYARFGKKKHRDYGNHDRVNGSRRIDYIVIHDTEGSYQGIPSMVNNPRYVSWHYTIRSSDGHVAQHVKNRDIAWHAGNWDINARSIGIEHEGYLARGGTWYTEAMYRSSARLVKHLATVYNVPIDRAHVIGHDNVPGTTPSTVAGMHEDPGPYWDWGRFFAMMGAHLKPSGAGSSVIIRPAYDRHQPRYTGCSGGRPAKDCKPHGSSSVWLHTAPSAQAPLVDDIGKRVGAGSTYSVYDHSARASTGQRYAVAGRSGDWTAIWYLGQKAWFHNPASAPTAIPAGGPLVTPVKNTVRVYGRAYPEKSAYRASRTRFQRHVPLKYVIRKGQSYSVGSTVTGTFQRADSMNPAHHDLVKGALRYHQIQLGHRLMFVKAKDVRVIG
ncbi:N-acetylmuramoyl-L-alanine amidase [Nonomuraea typhae]|uniref:N-acetylmuramoyl-L-alanine amidase n=1 Tax=Nonomuraea typhae TaxID=2603600 RepID=UPI0012F7FDC5|nr:peptidoglycan recognition family protein [Nonomuraea typhae]